MDHPFDYDLNLFAIPGSNGRTILCCHGYGDNYRIASQLKNLYCIQSTLISFNFPEYDIKKGRCYNPSYASFGTIDELLPPLFALKQIVIDQGNDLVDLYGFSAGGGAIINLIGVLNTDTEDQKLKKLDIGMEEKKRILDAIQNGIVILDTPLKSIEEIIAFRGSTEEFEILAKHYRDNQHSPIASLHRLKGLSLDILLHFQECDEILSNRDDKLYIEQLQELQPDGKLTLIITDEGGHMAPHHSLWRAYFVKISQQHSTPQS